MQSLPVGGGMFAFEANLEKLSELLRASPDVSVAAINGPAQTVVSVPYLRWRKLHAAEAIGIKSKKLSVSHAFHSRLMDPMPQ